MTKRYSEDLLGFPPVDDDDVWHGKAYKDFVPHKRCFESHPALKIGEFLIYGGSCSSPAVKDADIYIGFDHSMTFKSKGWPWKKQDTVEVVEFLFPITDMAAPHSPADFKDMVDWVCNQLQSGKKIHAGCIGGHGRTGLFLSAVYAQMTGDLDAITYVRTNYCKKAVESHTQVEFLNKHYGVTKVVGAKESTSTGRWSGKDYPTTGKLLELNKSYPAKAAYGDSGKPAGSSVSFSAAKRVIACVTSPKNIFGKKK